MGGTGTTSTPAATALRSVKSDPSQPLLPPDASTSAAPEMNDEEEVVAAAATAGPSSSTVEVVVDRDLLCPICMQMIRDAFLTACGHSFCYSCIVTHLGNKSDCPCCGHFLTSANLFPNFLLNKLLKKTCARELGKTVSPIEHVRVALQQGCEVSVKELDGLLSVLLERKRKMEQEEAESNMQVLWDFLHCLRRQKIEELNEIQTDLQYIKEDINEVERYRIELHRAKERHSVRLRLLMNNSGTTRSQSMDMYLGGINSNAPIIQHGHASGNQENKSLNLNAPAAYQGLQRKDTRSGSDPHQISPSGSVIERKRRVHAQVTALEKLCSQFIFHNSDK